VFLVYKNTQAEVKHHLGSPKNARQGDRRRVFFGVEEEFYES